MNNIKKVFSKIEFILNSNWLNLFLTFYVNFRSFSFSQAIKFPIWIYGQPKIYSLLGTMEIVGKVKTGMISFNKVQSGCPSLTSLQSNIHNKGKIKFYGQAIIGTGTKIVTQINGLLEIGEHVKITDMVNIACYTNVKVGDFSRIVHRCQIMDTNFHYIANLENKTISRSAHPIIIGKYCWICNSSTITGGCKLPNYTIVASNSLAGKDYTKTVPEESIIGGIPAKLLKTGFRKVENQNISVKLNEFFAANSIENEYYFGEIDKNEFSKYYSK